MIHELSRTVRFCVPLSGDDGDARDRRSTNTYAGSPTTSGLGAFYELEVRCVGTTAADTGYVLNISAIDDAVRDHGVPIIAAAVRDRTDRHPGSLLADILRRLESAVAVPVRRVTWRLTPFYSVAMDAEAMDRIVISQQFTFSASHRLHCAGLDDAANRQVFGKCNNEHGHGHNYRIDVAVAVPLPGVNGGDETAAIPFGLPELERLVEETLIRRLDHRHLNLDVPEFADLNPTVENIAKVSYDLLTGPLAAAGAHLRPVTVWETERTSCTYPV